MPSQRPENFRLNTSHNLYRGLVFAGLGAYHGPGTLYRDSSVDYAYPIRGNNGTRVGMASPSTATSGPVYIPKLGRWGDAFDGSNDYVTSASAPLSARTQLTISMWFNLRTGANYQSFIRQNTSVALETSFVTGAGPITAGGQTGLLGVVRNGDASSYGFCGPGLLVIDSWRHIAMVFDGAGSTDADRLKVYCSGVARSLTFASGIPASTASQTTATEIGRNVTIYTAGVLSDPCIWSRALSAAEIARLADPSNVMLDGLIVGTAKRNRISMYRGSTSKGIVAIPFGGGINRVVFLPTPIPTDTGTLDNWASTSESSPVMENIVVNGDQWAADNNGPPIYNPTNSDINILGTEA